MSRLKFVQPLKPLLQDPIPAPEDPNRPGDWAHHADTRNLHYQALNYLRGESFEPPVSVGDGIVYVGGGVYWPGIVVGIRMLRQQGCQLPVQVWYRESCEKVLPEQVASLGPIELINIEAHGKRTGARIIRGWEAKLYALAYCGYRRVIFLDADAYVVDKVEPLFQELQKGDFCFWSDLPGNYNTLQWSKVWEEGENGVPAVQGGQLVIDRSKAWKLILLAHWMCQHSDFYFVHMFGDQDCWRVILSVLAGEISWHCLGPAAWTATAFVLSTSDQVPRIVHRCQGKLFRIEDIPDRQQMYTNPQYCLPKEEEVFWHLSQVLSNEEKSPEETFELIYQKQLWGKGSGAGSLPAEARPFVSLVNFLLHWKPEIKRIVDLGCGDGSVGKEIEIEDYVGVDCCTSIVKKLGIEATDTHRIYFAADLNLDRNLLPAGDLAILKDVLHHWPSNLVLDWLDWARSCGKWKYLLLVYDRDQRSDLADCHLGGYRALSLERYPLNLFELIPVSEYLHKEVTFLKIS